MYNGNKYCFENKQYDVPVENNEYETESHVGHYYWSSDEEVAENLEKYSDGSASGSDVFFANHPESFEVNGQKGWSVLTGGDIDDTGNGEWNYLINKGDECGPTVRSGKYRYGVTVCGHDNCLILLPDDWKWDEYGVGNTWQNEYSETTTVKCSAWVSMKAFIGLRHLKVPIPHLPCTSSLTMSIQRTSTIVIKPSLYASLQNHIDKSTLPKAARPQAG